jgi:hypothetical protein
MPSGVITASQEHTGQCSHHLVREVRMRLLLLRACDVRLEHGSERELRASGDDLYGILTKKPGQTGQKGRLQRRHN